MVSIGLLLVAGVVGAYLTLGIAIYLLQRRLLYFPIGIKVRPAKVGLPQAEERSISTSDDEILVAWFLRNPGQTIAIYFHGQGASLWARADRIKQLSELGLSVLAVDYRGFGGSTGKPTQGGLHLDATAAYEEALSLGFAADRILLLGESLGSGVALELATRRPVAGIMLDSPYSSVVDVAAGRYWFLPVRRLLVDHFRSDLWIADVTTPILIVHGTHDRSIPIKYGRQLAAIGGAIVTFVDIPDAGHVVFGAPAADAPIRAWLKQFEI